MPNCQVCSNDQEEMYVFTKCLHFICYHCAVSTYQSNKLKCCDIITELQPQTIKILSYNYPRNSQTSEATNHKLNQIANCVPSMQNIKNKTNQENKEQVNDVCWPKVVDDKPKQKLRKQYIRDQIKQLQINAMTDGVPYPRHQKQNIQSTKKQKTTLSPKSHHEETSTQKKNMEPSLNKKEVINDKPQQNNNKSSQLQNILSLHIQRVRSQFSYLHKSIHHHQQQVVCKLLQIYSQELKGIQRPTTPSKIQKVNNILKSYVNDLSITKLIPNQIECKLQNAKKWKLQHDSQIQQKGFRNQVLRKLDVNEARMKERIEMHFVSDY